MLSKASFFLAFVAVAQVSVAATPPGCLLGAINTYEVPGDMKAVCGSTDYKSKIQSSCKDSTSASNALSAFAEICKAAGITVSTDVKSGSPSPSGTGTPSGTTTNGPGATGTTNNQGGTTTTTGAGPNNTGAAGRLEVGAAALFAGIGMLAAAL